MRHFLDIVAEAATSPLDNPRFREWFGNSKVVDAEGNPLVVYHGTFEDFDAFHPAPATRVRRGFNRFGYWFDAGTETPSYFGGGEKGNVMPVYLSIQRPLVLQSEAMWDEHDKRLKQLWREHKAMWDDYYARRKGRGHDERDYETVAAKSKVINAEMTKIEKETGDDAFDRLLRLLPRGAKSNDAEVDAVTNDIKAEGYDGILLKDTRADHGTRSGKATDWWIPFEPTQIKSVFNRGTWDKMSPKLSERDAHERRQNGQAA